MKTDYLKKKSLEIFGSMKSGAGLLVLSAVMANFLNFAYNAYLGRHLDLDDFGIITMVSTFVYLLNFFISSMSTTVTYTVSYLEGTGFGKGSSFFRKTWAHIFIPSLISSIAWIFTVPIVGHFLNVSDYFIIASFAPAIFFGALNAYNGGYLQGTWSFKMLAFLASFEALSKLILAVFFTTSGLNDFVAFAIPISIFLSWAGSTVCATIVYKKAHIDDRKAITDKKFSFSFYFASLMRGFSTVMFLSIDVILAKHFLSPRDAGVYSILSLVGKMIYFFGSLLNVFIVPVVSRLEGEGKKPKKEFSRLFAGTAFLSISAGLGLSLLGWFLVPLLLGGEARIVIPYLPSYSLAMMLFTLSTTVVLYRLARKHYIFPFISFGMSAVMIGSLFLNHSSVHEFVEAITKVNFLYFVIVVFSHFFYESLVYAYRNVRDVFYVFKKIPPAPNPLSGKMRILVFNWRDTKSVYAGGAETYVQSLASRWVKEGHAVTLFTSNDGHLPLNGETDGVRIIRRGGFYAVYAIASIYYLLHFRGKFDVIVDSENGIPFFTPLYAKEPVYCLVHHIHQDVFRKSLIWPLSALARFLEKDAMPLVYRNSNFITVSDSSKREMQVLQVTDKDIQIVHPGIDTDFLTPGEKALTPTVSYVGRLKEHKSVHLLIKAFKDVLVDVPNAHLIIAGDGEEGDKLKKLAKKLHVEDEISFLGKVSEEDKRDILRKSWVFVTPSMIEGWGITTIEANACGTPVIASDVPGLRDSVQNGETGFLVEYGDVGLLAQKITTLLNDQTLRDVVSQKAIHWSENFGWDKSSQKFIDAISAQKFEKPFLRKEESNLRTPGLLNILSGVFVLILVNKFSNSQVVLPKRVGSFNFLSQIPKRDQSKSLAIGIYEFGGKKFIAKRWEGLFKDLGYYSLVNEYNANKVLSKRNLVEKNIKFPSAISYIKDSKSLTVFFEYIKGDILDTLDIKTQATVISRVLDHFEFLSKNLSNLEQSSLGRRSVLYYATLLPVIGFISIVFNLASWKIILRSFFEAICSLLHLEARYSIAHRDITPSNIMVAGEDVYILDSENIVMTILGYDYAFLSVTPGLQKLVTLLPKHFANRNTNFLKNYIALHHILGSGSFLTVNSSYVKLLYELRT